MKILIAKRKNPSLNPRISINRVVLDHYEKASRLPGVKKNSFISFTKIEKLGINPGSAYKTPLGIYSYPVNYVLRKTKQRSPMFVLPFAGRSPFGHLFSVKGNIIDLNNVSNKQFGDLIRSLSSVYSRAKGSNPSSDDWKRDVDLVETWVLDSPTKAKIKTEGGQFWYVSMEAAKNLSKNSIWSSKKIPVIWNRLFREMGISGFFDQGEGIIHSSEPTQAVFFAKESIYNIKKAINKYSPSSLEDSEAFGKYSIRKKKEFYNLTEDQIIELIKKEPTDIQFVKNPSEKVQLAAIDDKASRIEYIKDPSEKVQIAAVENDGSSIQYIKDPSEKVQIAAVENDGSFIQYIKDPSEKAQIFAVQEDSLNIRYIKDPSEKAQIAAVENDGYSIHFIEDPSEKAQIAAVENDGSSIQFIEDPSEEVQIAAVENDGSSIQFIEDPSEEVQMSAVENDGSSIQFIEDPSEEVQMSAIKSSKFLPKYIRKPTPKAIKLYRELKQQQHYS